MLRHPLSALLIEFMCTVLVSVRLLLGPIRCRYPIGCTTFTIKRLRTAAIHTALWASFRRIMSCTSWQPLKEDLFE